MKNPVTLFGRRRACAGLLFACLGVLLPTSAKAASVTRGPYLQSGTPTSIIVRWRTSNATGGLVRYGTNVASLASTATDGFTTNRHAVSITGLVSNTKYFYELGTGSEWFAGGTNQFFVTAPPVGTQKPTRLWVLGDSGDPGPEAYSVRDAYAAFARAAQRDADLFLMLGDNAYGSGTDTEYQAAVFETYPNVLRNTVLWPTIGNHDKDPAYFEIFSLPQNGEAGGVASGTESYYSFNYANIHFVCLNSYRADRTTNGPMYQWLIADLQAHTADWLIAFWHHPPYTKGTHDSDVETELIEMRQRFVPLLESYGVDLVLSGHSHVYERTYFIDGHYGLTGTFTESMKKFPGDGRESGGGAYVKPIGEGNQGAVYTVAGNGAMASDPDPFPAVFSSSGEVGSLVIDISGNRLDLKHLQGNSNVTDFFTIIKEAATTNPPVAPTNLIATAVATNQIQLAWHDLSTNESSFRIERSTNGVNFAQVAVTPANATNAADLGLAAGTTYHYRVRARNQAGDSDYSPVAQATTFTPPPPLPDTTPPGAVTNLLVTAVTSNTVTLRWRAPGDDGYAGTAASYQLRFNTTAITESNWSNATPVAALPAPLPGGTTQNVTVAGLSMQTLYFFALKTADESNNVSPLSNLASGTTTAPSNPPVLIVSTSGVVIIASNSFWKFLDDGSDQGTAWRFPAFNDNAWASGPAQLGYGNFDDVTTVGYGLDPDNKFITTYFRRPFVVSDPSLFSALTARVRRDDGVVVYLNGTEVFRDNLTNAAISYLTRALVGVTGTNKTRFHPSPPIAATLLVPGTNLIAAEVHQRSATGSQMSFNFELVAAVAPPFIRIVHTNGQVALQWKTQPGQRYRVLRATELTPASWTSPWGDITATNATTSFNDPVGGGARFYRVMLVD